MEDARIPDFFACDISRALHGRCPWLLGFLVVRRRDTSMWRGGKCHVTRHARLIIFISAGAHSRVTSRAASASRSGHARQGGLRARARIHSRVGLRATLREANGGRARSSGFSKTPRARPAAVFRLRGVTVGRAASRRATTINGRRPRHRARRKSPSFPVGNDAKFRSGAVYLPLPRSAIV